MENDRELVRATIEQMVAEMGAVLVDSQEKYDFLAAWVKRNKETQAIVDRIFEEERVAKKADYDAVLDARAAMKNPLIEAEKVVRKRMTDWSTEREKTRRAEQERIEAERRKQIEDDRLKEAERQAALGNNNKADAIINKPIRVTKAEVEAAAPVKVGRTMEKWTVRCMDKSLFIATAALDSELLSCVSVSEFELAKICKARKILTSPGLEIKQEFVPVI